MLATAAYVRGAAANKLNVSSTSDVDLNCNFYSHFIQVMNNSTGVVNELE